MHCNLGYAEMGSAGCVHLPAEREFDAVRFWLSGDGSAAVRVQFACERGHRPAWCGELRYDRAAGRWIAPPDARLKHLAEAAVRAWMERPSEIL
ncbi:MAG: hypothetical protein WA532_06865 [Candidatus Korobacteraceae bacterium]